MPDPRDPTSGNDMVAAINALVATTVSKRAAEDLVLTSRGEQAIAICRGFAARVPISVMTSITGLTKGRIFQIRRGAFGLPDDDAEDDGTDVAEADL